MPAKHKNRTNPFLGIILVTLIFLAAAGIIIYSLGYRYVKEDNVKFSGWTSNGQPVNGKISYSDADCNGLKLYDRTAVEGAYSCFARRSATGAFNVRIPRQSGGRILLEVYRDSSPDVQEPVLVTEVGAEMLRNGYDWSREDLLDVSVGLDYSAAEVTIKIKDWIYDEFWNVQI